MVATKPFEHEQIEVNGIAVHTVSVGEGPLVVFCHGFPESWYSWRRYDKLPRVPSGLLVIGDAICSFNPIYGQGMTVAAMDALVLRDCLRDGGTDVSRRYFACAAEGIGVAWQMAVGSDLALPEVKAPRPISVRLPNTYNDWVLSAAESDLRVAEQFWKVLNLVELPRRLLRPAVMVRVALAKLRRLVSLPTTITGT
jgi:2-polyprenyl-6-methoxyphenol hydroxylase-like FAD-dependent oxidoreductase